MFGRAAPQFAGTIHARTDEDVWLWECAEHLVELARAHHRHARQLGNAPAAERGRYDANRAREPHASQGRWRVVDEQAPTGRKSARSNAGGTDAFFAGHTVEHKLQSNGTHQPMVMMQIP